MNRLDAIRQRVEAATPGPWVADGDHVRPGPAEPALTIGNHGVGYVTSHFADMAPGLVRGSRQKVLNDAAFIAHARQDLPDLLAVVEAARELMEWTPSNAAPVERLRAALAPLLEEVP